MNKTEIAKLLVEHPMIKILSESMNLEDMVRIMAEEIDSLEEAIGQAARNKAAQVGKQLKSAMSKNTVDKFLDVYYPDGEFSFGTLNVGGEPIEKHLANKPEDLISLKKRIIQYIAQALKTQDIEAPQGFGDKWIETPAQLPAVELTPPSQEPAEEETPERVIDTDVRENFEERLKDIVPEAAVESFLSFFTLLSRQQIQEQQVSLPAAMKSADLLGGTNTAKVRQALLQMPVFDRKTVLSYFRELDSTKQTYVIDMLKEVIPQVTPVVEPEIEEPEAPAPEPEVEPLPPIAASDLEAAKEDIQNFFSDEEKVGFMKQLFLSDQGLVLQRLLTSLRDLTGKGERAKAITEQNEQQLDLALDDRRVIVKDMKNIKITLEDLVDLIRRYNKVKDRISPDARFDGTKLKLKVQQELEDTQLAIARLYKRIVSVILSGEDIIKEQEEVSPEDKATNVRRAYGELLTVYNDTLEPIITKKAQFDEKAVRDAAESMLGTIIDSRIIDYFPSQRFSPKVDPSTTLDKAMGHLGDSLKEIVTFISRVFARVNTNDVTEAQARTFLKRLRGIAEVMERDFGADSMINALPEVEEEKPQTAIDAGTAQEFGPGFSEPWPSNLQEQLIPLLEKFVKDQHG